MSDLYRCLVPWFSIRKLWAFHACRVWTLASVAMWRKPLPDWNSLICSIRIHLSIRSSYKRYNLATIRASETFIFAITFPPNFFVLLTPTASLSRSMFAWFRHQNIDIRDGHKREGSPPCRSCSSLRVRRMGWIISGRFFWIERALWPVISLFQRGLESP